jgi:hypothetical protein
MRSARARLRFSVGLGAACALSILVLAGPASAVAAVYPAGGGTFSGGAEGWMTIEKRCEVLGMTEVGALCEGKGGYDGAHGVPAGSLAAETTATINALSTFKSKVVLESPQFTAAEGGGATLRLDRQFEAAQLVSVAPKATLVATLVDQTSGSEAGVLTEELASEATFSDRTATVALTQGHVYVLRLNTEITSTTKAALTGASGAVRFDNVSVTVGSAGGNGGGTGGGGAGSGSGGSGSGGVGSLTNASLASLMQGSLGSSATLKGNKLFVKVKCPKKVGRACRVTVQGMIKKGKAATSSRTVKIAKGKSKRLVLKVKPKMKTQVAKKKKLLFKETVKAGKAKATVYKRLKLIRH